MKWRYLICWIVLTTGFYSICLGEDTQRTVIIKCGNQLNRKILRELCQAIKAAERDKTKIVVIQISGKDIEKHYNLAYSFQQALIESKATTIG